ncbi:MAG: hypothetical protein JOZ81_10515 [Chloroflexi bacterium]|nr:hypothetical protein [Chloroflexota bacterium]
MAAMAWLRQAVGAPFDFGDLVFQCKTGNVHPREPLLLNSQPTLAARGRRSSHSLELVEAFLEKPAVPALIVPPRQKQRLLLEALQGMLELAPSCSCRTSPRM